MTMTFDRRLLENFDWKFLVLVLLLAAIGILNLRSAAAETGLWKTQAYYLLIGLGALAVILFFDYRQFEDMALLLYLGCLGLLILVHFFGETVRNSRSWFHFGPLRLQPSELAKIGLILLLARFYHRDKTGRPSTLRELFLPLLVVGLPAAAIALEPDMGTALVVLLLGGTMLLFMGIERRTLILLVGLGLLSIYPAWHYVLKPHQKVRILTFLHPESEPLGVGYNLIQSKIAIGSGGALGKGFMRGSQNQLRFLPEQHTDFALSVWAEEWGFFLGVLPVLLLYAVLLAWALAIARSAKDRFGVMLAFGVATLLFWHVLINLAMIVGLFPVIGLPLSLFSYGGSHLLTVMIGVGILLNVRMRRFFF